MLDRVELAVSCFGKGFSCSQAVFSIYASHFGLPQEAALKIATSFGGGMARMGDTCGAVTGAFMVIGLRHGRTRAEDKDAKEKTYNLVHKFAEEFAERNGSIVCRELLGCDLGTPEGYETAKREGYFDTVCPKLVQDAAEIIEEILI
jgi:C_GCAxxG_C_C family probable redox protein